MQVNNSIAAFGQSRYTDVGQSLDTMDRRRYIIDREIFIFNAGYMEKMKVLIEWTEIWGTDDSSYFLVVLGHDKKYVLQCVHPPKTISRGLHLQRTQSVVRSWGLFSPSKEYQIKWYRVGLLGNPIKSMSSFQMWSDDSS